MDAWMGLHLSAVDGAVRQTILNPGFLCLLIVDLMKHQSTLLKNHITLKWWWLGGGGAVFEPELTFCTIFFPAAAISQ